MGRLSPDCELEHLSDEHEIEQYKDDPSFKLLSVSNERFDLSDRVKAVREMFELGHKVRAETKIRNRQPLRKAYILFSDPKIQHLPWGDTASASSSTDPPRAVIAADISSASAASPIHPDPCSGPEDSRPAKCSW